jgi:hypothetical protein
MPSSRSPASSGPKSLPKPLVPPRGRAGGGRRESGTNLGAPAASSASGRPKVSGRPMSPPAAQSAPA